MSIVLGSPSPGGTLGAASAATLAIHVAGQPIPVNNPPPLSVRSLGLNSSRKGVKQLVLQLDGQVAAGQATTLADYTLVSAGNDRRFGTRDDRTLRIASAGFNAVSDQVTLTLAKPIKLTQPYRLTVLGGPGGLPLAGGSYQVLFGRPPRSLPGKGKSVKAKRAAAPALRNHATRIAPTPARQSAPRFEVTR